jgi:two-component system, NtrC family, response regulator GlrR
MSLNSFNILIVDDDQVSSKTLIRGLKNICSEEFNFHSESSAQDALDYSLKNSPEVAVVDLSLDEEQGPESGLNLISELIEQNPTIRILVLTGHGSEQFGIKALHRGATSFINKPADRDHLAALIKDAAVYASLKKEFVNFSSPDISNSLGLKSKNPKMIKCLADASYATSNNQPLLITGETGTGKGVLAQAIHKASSNRSGMFVRFQPSFGNNDLIASELFGHTKGAFTGALDNRKGLIESADRGTLFIDEVDELPVEVQILLLNVLQEKTFRALGSNKDLHSNFRLIAATNRPVEQSLEQGKLRQDFFHRIAHFQIAIPPLRERTEDIPYLAEQFIREFSNREKIPVQGLTPPTLSKLCSYSWPGNVRELQAVIEGAVYRANYRDLRFIEIEDLSLSSKLNSDNNLGSFRDAVNKYELSLVEQALKRFNGNQSEAARSLNLDRTSLRRVIARKK